MEKTPYKLLAERLDALPNGFPSTPDGAELRLLAKLFTPQEAELASSLRLTLETPQQLAGRLGRDPAELRQLLKQMVKKGLIRAGKLEDGLGYGLIPFVVGIYENQNARLDPELAALFEAYYLQAFGAVLEVQPALHRVIPVGESIRAGLEISPYESAAEILSRMQSWGVLDCICRMQKALIGDPCQHPVDVCLAMSTSPGVFDQSETVRPLTQQEALDTLHRAAQAGLVHSVSNNQQGTWYICNCCTCSCGVLRGIKDLGMANVIAHSAFLCQVDADRCSLCGDCLERCQFGALSLQAELEVDARRCIGCGVCTLVCLEQALFLVKRPEDDVLHTPETMQDWLVQRAEARRIDLGQVL